MDINYGNLGTVIPFIALYTLDGFRQFLEALYLIGMHLYIYIYMQVLLKTRDALMLFNFALYFSY